MSRTSHERVEDILEAIVAIEQAGTFLESDAEDDMRIDLAIDAICYRLITIGEAVKALDPRATGRFPQVEWSNIARLRDVITHHYHRRDAEIILATINEPLALLKAATLSLRESSADK